MIKEQKFWLKIYRIIKHITIILSKKKKKITLEEEKIIFFGKGKNSARVNEDISIKLGKEEIDTLHFSEKHKMKENKMNTEEKTNSGISLNTEESKHSHNDSNNHSVDNEPTNHAIKAITSYANSDINDQELKEFLLKPLPKNYILECNIKRIYTGIDKLHPKYNVFVHNSNFFLMCAGKRSNKSTSNYLLSFKDEVYSKNEIYNFGKLRSNFFGTIFNIFGNGKNRKDTKKREEVRQQFGTVTYETNLFGLKGPTKFNVYLPKIEEKDIFHEFKPIKEEEEIHSKFKHGETKNIIKYVPREPKWSEKHNAYVLHYFNGRIQKPSSKNFQLIEVGKDDDVILQFGRIDDETFAMDFKYPLSPLQAFGICLSSLDNKFACE